jgi:hypothetical protein
VPRQLLAILSALVLHGCATSVTAEHLQAWAAEKECTHPTPGHVVYDGDSAELGTCLDGAGSERIRELRITSRGGDAWETLQIMQRFSGRIDLVIVDHMCASSCANYVLPAAKRILVRSGSIVILHGSIDLQVVADYADSHREELHRQHPEVPAEQLDESMGRMLDEFKAKAASQAEFERERLRCRDWLDPRLHFASQKVPPQMKWLVVTRTMAERCLKETRIDRFWDPPTQHTLSPDGSFLRADH